MGSQEAPRTTRARLGLTAFGVLFGFGEDDASVRADGGDTERNAPADNDGRQ